MAQRPDNKPASKPRPPHLGGRGPIPSKPLPAKPIEAVKPPMPLPASPMPVRPLQTVGATVPLPTTAARLAEASQKATEPTAAKTIQPPSKSAPEQKMAFDPVKMQETIDQIVDVKEALDPVIAGAKNTATGGSSTTSTGRAKDGYFRLGAVESRTAPISATIQAEIVPSEPEGMVSQYMSWAKSNPTYVVGGAVVLGGLGWYIAKKAR